MPTGFGVGQRMAAKTAMKQDRKTTKRISAVITN
jgi:hypothetical protein